MCQSQDPIVDANFFAGFLQRVREDPVKGVLVVEDHNCLLRALEEYFGHLARSVAFFGAATAAEGERLQKAHEMEIDVSSVDACAPGDTMNTGGLIRNLLDSPRQPLVIGTSSKPACLEALRRAGCHLVFADKTKIMAFLRNHNVFAEPVPGA